MTRDQQVIAIAEAFSELMRQWLSPEEFAAMKHKNEADPTYAGKVCASHDYCDANMAMWAAFRDVMGRDIDGDSDADCAIWNEAWDLARKLYLGSQRHG
ncbi:hypothetical protein [Bradyrhizobium elkanii]|nr:hypothetical protein [Bradyrhizobium elkanii]WLA79536.1 hypothetical protein QNJ99_29565 [Bradyrhizobium elkanii]